ncbi:MAG: heavy metal translocating P-type ATPase metal-binding domain-containing protein [Saprospiraceae bacterium]|nr:heavy metal translocating P-type ATPase metal-binding domain-containing protein [Saprospiraceae bacterium]
MGVEVNTGKKIICAHCGGSCDASIKAYESFFCCNGCKVVYGLLQEKGLCDYYEFNAHPGQTIQSLVSKSKYEYLDNEDIRSKLIVFKDHQQSHVNFYLPQMHCSSCLYLLENLHRLNSKVISARVDFVRKEVLIAFFHADLLLSELVVLLASIGYEPHISFSGNEGDAYRMTDRSRIYKLGMAGFCFANIMMMSLPQYFAGSVKVEPSIALALKYGMLALSLPVVFYSGAEFFISSWNSLKEKYLNIDVPIALAIAITFIRSVYEIFWGSGEGYFDSLAGIIFFMLVGRLLQDNVYKSLSFDRDFKSFFPIAVRCLIDEEVSSKPLDQVEPDDVLVIRPDEIIPVDGILSKGKAYIDYSFVTGESLPVEVAIGELIYAGGKQTGEKIEVIAIKSVSQSYLTNLWNKNVFKDKSKSRSYIDIFSKYFTLILFVLAGITAVYWLREGRPDMLWSALTSMFIIACPCALLLTATFTYGRLMRMFGKNGLYIRHHDVVEKMSEIDYLVFDKTGTLTNHSPAGLTYHGRGLEIWEKGLIHSLAGQSSHPLSRAIAEHLKESPAIEVESYKNHPGKGIEGWYENKHVKLGSAEFTGVKADEHVFESSIVYYSIDNEVKGWFEIRNAYRPGVSEMIRYLKKKYKIAILSGDHEGEKEYLNQLIGADNQSLFTQSPQQKFEFIKSLQQKGHTIMMIGDGLNDAGALKQSDVGIAISDSVNNFTPAADGILEGSALTGLSRLMKLATAGRYIIYLTFFVSVLYNLVGLWFAVQGILYPVVAAILMPASSLTIIFLTYTLSGLIGKKLNLKD